MLRREEAV